MATSAFCSPKTVCMNYSDVDTSCVAWSRAATPEQMVQINSCIKAGCSHPVFEMGVIEDQGCAAAMTCAQGNMECTEQC